MGPENLFGTVFCMQLSHLILTQSSEIGTISIPILWMGSWSREAIWLVVWHWPLPSSWRGCLCVCVCEQRLVGLFFLLGSKDAEEKFPEKKSIEGTYSDLLAPSGGFRSDWTKCCSVISPCWWEWWGPTSGLGDRFSWGVFFWRRLYWGDYSEAVSTSPTQPPAPLPCVLVFFVLFFFPFLIGGELLSNV